VQDLEKARKPGWPTAWRTGPDPTRAALQSARPPAGPLPCGHPMTTE